MKEAKFYCDCCGETSMFLKEKNDYHACPSCGHMLFENDEELREYLDYPDISHKVPFEKPKKARGERLGQGRAYGN